MPFLLFLRVARGIFGYCNRWFSYVAIGDFMCCKKEVLMSGLLQYVILIVEITFFKCCSTKRWFWDVSIFMFHGWFCDVALLLFQILQYKFFNVALHNFLYCSTYFSMLQYIVLQCCSTR
jgi:hypothetical protein